VKKRKSGGRGGESSDRHYIQRGGGNKFMAPEVPRQCPLVLLVKVDLVKVRRLEVEKVR
jgi:hypothetical protein